MLREAADEGGSVAAEALRHHEDTTVHLRNLADDLAAAEEDGDADAALDIVESLKEHAGRFCRFPDLLEKALGLFERAARTGASGALVSEAVLLDGIGRWDEAPRVLEEGIRRFPQESRLPYVLGLKLRERGELTAGEPLLRISYEAREAKPGANEAAYWLGRSLLGQGRAEEAAEWLRTAVEVHPIVRRRYAGLDESLLFDPHVDLAGVLFDLGLDGEAVPLVEAVLGEAPRQRDAVRPAERPDAGRAERPPERPSLGG